jgi:hypothetical protein
MATQTTLPQFKGRPLIEIPSEIPQASFLEGDFGEAVNQEVQDRYGKFKAVSKIGYSAGVVKGSNPFYVVAVNEVIRPQGLRTATQADLESVLKTNAFGLRGFYEDSALVLRTEETPNEYLAKNLMEQVKAIYPEMKMPVMIPLYSLELTEDSSSEHGVSFKLREGAEVNHAPILNKNGGNFLDEDIYANTGLPSKLSSKGNRTLYTRSSGVSRLYLSGGLYLDSYVEFLAYSDGDGRVVLISGEATQKSFGK